MGRKVLFYTVCLMNNLIIEEMNDITWFKTYIQVDYKIMHAQYHLIYQHEHQVYRKLIHLLLEYTETALLISKSKTVILY